MSRRRQLEHEVSVAQERIKKAAKDTPKNILKLWEQELVDLELELNNMGSVRKPCGYVMLIRASELSLRKIKKITIQ